MRAFLAALLIAAFIRDRNIRVLGRELNLSRWIIGIVGFSYIVVPVLAAIITKMRVEAIGIQFLGEAWANIGKLGLFDVILHANSSLQIGYWLACAVGPLLVILALLRNRIRGRA